MSKKRGILDGLLKAILSFSFDRLMKDASGRVRNIIFDAIKPLIKKIVLATVGIGLATIGVLFVCISLVKYISIYFEAWIAWGSIGIVTLVVGFIASIIALRK